MFDARYKHSPNRACLYGVLATNLLIACGILVLPRADDFHFCHTCAVPFTFWIRHFSESCCGPQESPLYVLRHLRPSSLGPQNLAVVPAILKMRKCVVSLRPLLSSKSFKHDSKYKHSGTSPFWFWSIIIDFSSKTIVVIRLFGLPNFW